MEPVRIGVVGCGVIGPSHMAACAESPLTELIAVADLIEERARTAAERFNVPKVYREGSDLVEDPDVEAVVLAFPAQGRTALGLHALANGKHLLTEKPVAMNAAEVKQLIATQGELTAACCSSRYRFVEGARIATDFVASGELGELRTVRIRHVLPCGAKPSEPRPEWRLKKHLNAGGFLCNWGCYDLDYLLGICGWRLKPLTCFAQTWTIPPQFASHVAPGSDAETYYIALIRCEGGTMLSMERGEYMPCGEDAAWQIIGTNGSLSLRMLSGNPKQIIFDETSEGQGTSSRVLWEGDEDTSAISRGPVLDLATAIRENREPATSLEKALVIAQITDAVYASAEKGTAVPVG
ncbi:MAG: Gfo/Idh/MocA family protein [Candidatus Zipacnadales bacterium]